MLKQGIYVKKEANEYIRDNLYTNVLMYDIILRYNLHGNITRGRMMDHICIRSVCTSQ